MRQVILDTETTGLDAKEGHRIIEIGCLELLGRQLTERRFHHYLNPERPSDEGAVAVHGLTDEFLADKPKFADVVDDFLDFVRDAEVIIHNAAFDIGFLDAELARLKRPAFARCCVQVTDTLKLARTLHPGKRNSLDALCERYQVSNAHRTLHGALLDAGLLADVYLAMTRGQDVLDISLEASQAQALEVAPVDATKLIVLKASEAERQAHQTLLEGIEKSSASGAVWHQAMSASPD